MVEKIYVVVRNYKGDGASVECFKNKEQAKQHALTMAQEDHKHFECEEDFEQYCFNWEEFSNVRNADGSFDIWLYENKYVIIEILEVILK
jgi:hypothetical protein